MSNLRPVARTRRPFATISYNTEEFLKNKLNDLMSSERICFWAYIKHKAEKSCSGDGHSGKDHIHLFMIPYEEIDTRVLRKEFQEPVPDNKPLGIMICTASEFAYWVKYALHDAKYLAANGWEREFHYKLDEIHVSDADEFDEMMARVTGLTSVNYIMVENYVAHGYGWRDILREVKGNPGYMKEWYRTAFHYLFNAEPEDI